MHDHTTSWTLVEGAAAGRPGAREAFVLRYEAPIRAYFDARWRGRPNRSDVDDAVQDVFICCFRPGGALGRAEQGRSAGFRGYLRGIVRNVALMAERRRARTRVRQAPTSGLLEQIADENGPADRAFDRAWAASVLKEATERHRQDAARKGEAAMRRVELLALRFHEGKPIREIARLWGVEAAHLHHEYAVAREEFRAALRAALAFQCPDDDAAVDNECRQMLEALG